MPLYESTFIARPEISVQQVEALTERFSGIIKENGGSVPKSEYWGVKTLAYRIKKNRKGHYVMFNIDAPSTAVQEMERNMRIHEDVMRYLTIRVEELESGPSQMMQTRTSRYDRSGPRGERHGRFGRGSEGAPASGDKPAAPEPDKAKVDGAADKSETGEAANKEASRD